jgi:hypothetical protein
MYKPIFVHTQIFSVHRMNDKCTVKRTEGESTPQYKEKMFCERRPSEAWFPPCDLLNIKENAQSVHLGLQHRTLHIWTVIVWPAAKFQVPYESPQTHSVFVVASPGRRRLLQHKQQTADVTTGKHVRDLHEGNGQALLLVRLCCPLFWKHAVQELPNCKKEMWWTTVMHEP